MRRSCTHLALRKILVFGIEMYGRRQANTRSLSFVVPERVILSFILIYQDLDVLTADWCAPGLATAFIIRLLSYASDGVAWAASTMFVANYWASNFVSILWSGRSLGLSDGLTGTVGVYNTILCTTIAYRMPTIRGNFASMTLITDLCERVTVFIANMWRAMRLGWCRSLHYSKGK